MMRTEIVAAALAPLLLCATDLRSGIELGSGVATTIIVLLLASRVTRTAPATGFSLALWSTLAAAVASWTVAAWTAALPDVVAIVPLAAVSAALWRTDARRIPLPPLVALTLAPAAVGALRSTVAVIERGVVPTPVPELLAWLASPVGLLILAALAAALRQALRHRPVSPAQDSPSA